MKKTLFALLAIAALSPVAMGEKLTVTAGEDYNLAVDSDRTAHLQFGSAADAEGTYTVNVKADHENKLWAINRNGADGYSNTWVVGTAVLNFEDGSTMSYKGDASGDLYANKTIIQAESGATASLTSCMNLTSNITVLQVNDGGSLTLNGLNAKTAADTEMHISLGTGSTLTFGGRASLGVDNTSYAKSLTLEFGAGSLISAAGQTISFGDTMKNAGSSISITAQLSDAEMEQVKNATYGTIIERTLITCGSIDHLHDCGGIVTGSVAQLSALGMQSVGIVTDASLIAANQYGFVKNGGTLKLYINTPEPATATLSLLALAGLAARRRRH